MIKLYVGNLPYSLTDQSLGDMFADYGPVASSTVITDKMSGRSKGFGFVELEDDTKGQEAIQKLNGSSLENRNIVVSVARPMEERPRRFDDRNKGGFGDRKRERY